MKNEKLAFFAKKLITTYIYIGDLQGTLRILIRRAYTVCSNDNLLWQELHHIEKSFH